MEIKYKRPKLNIEYDMVAIIDCLSQDERAQFDQSDQIKLMLNNEGIPWKVFGCPSKAHLNQTLGFLAKCAREGKKVCLHFIAHGNQEGIELAKRDFISWSELRPLFTSLNEAMSGDLIVNMTTCQGLHGIKIVDLTGGSDQLFGIIGPKDELTFVDAIDINRRLFTYWIAGGDMAKIVERINQEMGREILSCLSAEGYRGLKSDGA